MGVSDAVVELSGVANPAIFKQESQCLGKTTYNFIWEVDSYSPIIEYQFWFREFVVSSKMIMNNYRHNLSLSINM